MSRYILVALALGFLPPTAARAGVADGTYFAALQSAVGQADADEPRKQVADLLGRARQAMTEGNLETADSLVARAEGLNVTFGLFHTGDTPKKARRDLEKVRADRGGSPQAADPFAGKMPTTLAAATAPMGEAGTSAAPAAAVNLPQFALQTQANTTGAAPAPGNTIIPLPNTGGSEVRLANVNEPAPFSAPSAVAANDPARKQRVLELVHQARAALSAGDVRGAELLAREADGLGVADKDFGPQDDRAWLVLMEVEKQQRRGVMQAGAEMPAGANFAGQQAVYDPANDATRNMPAAAETGLPTLAPINGETPAMQALNAGEEAMRRRDLNAAQNYFKQALANQEELDPVSLQRLQDRMALVGTGEAIGPGRPEAGLMDQAAQAQALQARQVSSEVARLEQQSRQLQENDPAQAQAVLQQARVVVEKSTLDAGTKEMMIRRLDRDAVELQRFVDVNRPRIELLQQNKETQSTLDREQVAKLEMQNKLARLVEEYNVLVEQQRFAEAEVTAKRAQEIGPNEPITQQLAAQSKALRRIFNNAEIGGLKEDAFVTQMTSIERSSIANVTTENPMALPKNWEELRGKRGPINGDSRRRSPKELEIEQKLKTPVSLKFANAPLAQVFEKLSAMTGVPIYVDNRGLGAEGVDSSTPITIDISTEISLKSALNLILAEHHLTYVIKNEVLKITSDRLRSEEVYPVTYAVGDLIIPIPNFVPTSRMGLAGALADAQASVGAFGSPGFASHAPINVIAGSNNADSSVLGQMPIPFASGGGGPAQSGTQQNVPFGPGGMGGGVQPDFESLIELMTTTIEPETWREAGGTQGEVKSHQSTLSLVITQTQAVHEQIEDLLNQLRQLQDLQVTIEVRFIRLSDSFYEQIGIDFDLDINDNADVPFQIFGRPDTNAVGQVNRANFSPSNALLKDSGNPPRDVQDRDSGQSATVGMSAPGVFSTDLDIPFSQSTLQTAAGALTNVPTFTATSPGGANLGFAILSDLEAYFFITAVQDDTRSNILQAPKVTMFNGQQAFVSDTVQSPFVISVTPVVGDFAAAQQPVIVVLNEGTSLSVQAVVSNDRRFVRLTMVPFFSQINDVSTFTFEGSESTTNSSSSNSATQGPGQQEDSEEEEQTVTRSGTTVQLPQFAFQTVTTTVSVPDGGTVLLGGIKRMREDRRENGVPLLNKLPYINRLFNNVAIGKSSESLMMMVTPRIIIQSEEEEAIGVTAP